MKSFVSPESRVLPGITGDSLQPALIQRLRAEATALNPEHAWRDRTDAELLRDAGLSVHDEESRETGFTVAALLLLGTQEAIRAALPFEGTQAHFRPGNWRRGSRLNLRMSLLETLDHLMAFAAEHLPDHGETDAEAGSINLRDAVLSELFSHSLISRDYGKPYPARFVIEGERVFLENGVASKGNPLLTHAFEQIGLGRNPAAKDSQLNRWGKVYFGMTPLVLAGSVQRIVAPFPKKLPAFPEGKPALDITEMLTTQAPWTHLRAAQEEVSQIADALSNLVGISPQEGSREETLEKVPPVFRPVPHAAVQSERTEKILAFCKTPRYRSELQAHVGIVNRDYFRKDILNPLIEKGLLRPTLPDKPNSPKQQYATAAR